MSALSDLRVIDLSSGIAGPYCTKMLSDFGAEVIKVEHPQCPDPSRSLGPFPEGCQYPQDVAAGGMFLYLNGGKKPVTLDMDTEQGRTLFTELVESADLVAESFSPGYMDGLRLGYGDLEKLNSGVILVSLTPFGQTGPWAAYQATDLTINAASGISYVTGYPDREPLKEPGHETDYQTGAAAFLGAMTALAYRDVSGIGQHVDVSAQEAALSTFSPQFLGAMHSGSSPTRGSARLMPCKDGYVSLNVRHDATWEYMWLFFEEPEMIDDERFATAPDRRRNIVALEDLLEPRLARYTMEELFHGLAPLRILVGMVLEIDRLLIDPHLQERGFFVDQTDPELGKMTMPGAPFLMSDTPWQEGHISLDIGSDNREVYCGLLGHDDAELGRWKEQGIV